MLHCILIIGCHPDMQLDELHRFHTYIPQSENPSCRNISIFQGNIHEFTIVNTISKSWERQQNLSSKKTLIGILYILYIDTDCAK